MVAGSPKALVSIAATFIAAPSSSSMNFALAFTNTNNGRPSSSRGSKSRTTTNVVEYPRGTTHRGLAPSPLLPPLFMSTLGSFPDNDAAGVGKPSESDRWNNNEREVTNNSRNAEESAAADELDASSSSDSSIAEEYKGPDGFSPLADDAKISRTRQMRWDREAYVRSKYAVGDEVVELRRNVAELREELVEARKGAPSLATTKEGDGEFDNAESAAAAMRRVDELEREILELNARDAEFAYAVAKERIETALATGDEEGMEHYRRDVQEARLCIPALNLHGIWVGKYGTHGYEMINVTYSGDTLIATKVTGDKNVPRHEVSFTADLSPRSSSSADDGDTASLEPIELNARAVRQWGKKFLTRHSGRGQVASEGYHDAQWMEGQLILVGRFFSFAWVPIGHQVFFGRPSPELTIKMLREANENDNEKDQLAGMRNAVERCWDETYWTEREMDAEVGGRRLAFSDSHEDHYDQEGCFE